MLKAGSSLLSPVLLPVGDDGQTVRVVPVAADVRVPPGHPCRRSVILQERSKEIRCKEMWLKTISNHVQ